MIRKKLHTRLGLTLAETLTALAVFAILSVALVSGTSAAWKVCRKAVTASEARTLQSTLVQSLSNELRYGRNIEVSDGIVTFDSDTFGEKVSVQSEGGRVKIKQNGEPGKIYDLLPEKAYTSGLKAKAEVSFREESGIFTLKIIITHPFFPADGQVTTLKIQSLNPPGP